MKRPDKGSIPGFALGMIGAILAAIGFLIILFIFIISKGSYLIPQESGGSSLLFNVLFLIFWLIVTVGLFYSSFKLKKKATLLRGSVMLLIFSVLSFNLLAFMGSLIGLMASYAKK